MSVGKNSIARAGRTAASQPEEKKTAVKKAAPVKKETPAKKAAPAKRRAPAKKPAPAAKKEPVYTPMPENDRVKSNLICALPTYLL